MSYGKANAALYLILVGVFVMSSYFNYPYFQLLSMFSSVILTVSILWSPVGKFIDWFSEALREWKETL